MKDMMKNTAVLLFHKCNMCKNMCSLFSVFPLFYLILENMSTNVIFDSCDVVYNWSISLLPPIVLDNLFGY